MPYFEQPGKSDTIMAAHGLPVKLDVVLPDYGRLICNQQVGGSTPLASPILFKGLAVVGRFRDSD